MLSSFPHYCMYVIWDNAGICAFVFERHYPNCVMGLASHAWFICGHVCVCATEVAPVDFSVPLTKTMWFWAPASEMFASSNCSFAI